MIPSWKEAPFIRLLAPLVAGILAGQYLQINIPFSIALVPGVIIILYSHLSITVQYRLRFYIGLLLQFMIFISGVQLVFYNDLSRHKKFIGNHLENADRFIALMEEPFEEKASSYKTKAKLLFVQNDSGLRNVNGSIWLYLRKDSSLPSIKPGTIISFNRKLQSIAVASNPGGFDYKKYSSYQQVYFQVYLAANDLTIEHQPHGFLLKNLIFSSRDRLIEIFHQYINDPKARGLAEALTIGYKGDLDRDLLQAYSNTGVVHVIAISGLHLGLIYLILSKIVARIPLKKKIVKGGIIIFGLFGFSLIAGAAPSILRSAVMFSFIVIGNSLQRKPPIINSLSASAFLLLCYNPFWIWDIGFQLSYSAVLGLVLLSRPIYLTLYIRNKFLNKIWEMWSVTLAAQLFTLPIILYYFHQFPLLFLFTNLFIVPLSGIALSASLILCSISFIPFLAILWGEVVTLIIRVMNSIVQYFNSLPFANISDIPFSLVEAFLSTLCIIFLCQWFLMKNSRYIIYGVGFIAILLSYQGWLVYISSSEKKIIIYNAGKHHTIDLIASRRFISILSPTLLNDSVAMAYNIRPARVLNRLEQFGPSYLLNKSSFLRFSNKRIAIITEQGAGSLYMDSPTDFLIILGPGSTQPSELLRRFPSKYIVLGASLRKAYAREWKTETAKLGIPVYDISEQGAFVLRLN